MVKKYLNLWIQSNRDTKNDLINEKKALIHNLKRICTPVFLSWKKVYKMNKKLKKLLIKI